MKTKGLMSVTLAVFMLAQAGFSHAMNVAQFRPAPQAFTKLVSQIGAADHGRTIGSLRQSFMVDSVLASKGLRPIYVRLKPGFNGRAKAALARLTEDGGQKLLHAVGALLVLLLVAERRTADHGLVGHLGVGGVVDDGRGARVVVLRLVRLLVPQRVGAVVEGVDLAELAVGVLPDLG